MTKSYPGDSADYLPADVSECIEFLAKSSPKEVMAHRLKQVVFVKRLVRDCADEQQALEASLHPSVKRVMQGKQIVAICELLKLMNLDDPYFVKGLREGFSLVGSVPSCGWEFRDRPAVLTVGQWMNSATELRRE
eukprot:5791802-Amphidinium_carterae.1